jgi:FAD synthetase
MREDAAERTARYLETTTAAVKRLKTKKLPSDVSESSLQYVLELVHGYVRDAKHFAESERPVTSLACIAYAEGLLDALKFLELAEF